MRRITLWIISTITAIVLLFSYKTSLGGAATAATTTISTPATTSSDTGGSDSADTSTTKTYNGSVASTRWGDVQVTITVANGKITNVAVPVYPHDNGRDQEINAYALPVLRQETMTAQNAHIDTVSGATVTSNGYLESLQAALDAAHLS